MAITTALVGATGLVGSHILTILLAHVQISSVSGISRRPLESLDSSSKLNSIVDSTSDNWPATCASIKPRPHILFSGLGTTRGAAGGLEGQREIDYDLNLAIARAAKNAGVNVYVLISAAGANSKSYIPYSKMKGELEEAVKAIGFDATVFVKPGLLVGKRPTMKFGEPIAHGIVNALGRISGNRLKDGWAQDADVVARAAVSAGILALEGKAPEGEAWHLSQADIIRLGRII